MLVVLWEVLGKSLVVLLVLWGDLSGSKSLVSTLVVVLWEVVGKSKSLVLAYSVVARVRWGRRLLIGVLSG